jgi:hypothetical protein
MAFDTLQTADYSPLVVHFTKGPQKRMVLQEQISRTNPLFVYRQTSARDRLINILKMRVIYASPMPFLPTEQRAVCFTECIWEGLTSLADSYSPYGIVFSKRLIFDAGGGPALYLRGDLLQAFGGDIPEQLHAFIAPFDPDGKNVKSGVRLDWLHEREWRLGEALKFDYADITHVLVESNRDSAEIVHEIGAQNLPDSKVIPIEVYRNIRKAWSE